MHELAAGGERRRGGMSSADELDRQWLEAAVALCERIFGVRRPDGIDAPMLANPLVVHEAIADAIKGRPDALELLDDLEKLRALYRARARAIELELLN